MEEFLNEWLGTIVVFILVLGFFQVADSMVPLRGWKRWLMAALLALVYKNYGYIVTDKVVDWLEMWGLDLENGPDL